LSDFEILPIYKYNPTHPVIAPKIKPPFISGDWNRMTKWIFSHGSFIEAYIARLKTNRDNAVIIEGERGEGKTNVLLFFLEYFNTYFKVPFSVDRNVFLGRDVDLTVNWIAEDFKKTPLSAIGIDESEIPFSRYTAHSIQNREAKIFMDTFRELQLGVFLVCPDKDILDQRIVDRCNWNIICDWNDEDKKEVEITVEYYGKTKDRTRFKWLKYEEIIIPYVSQELYDTLRYVKHADLYSDVGLIKDFHEKRKGKIKDVKKIAKIEQTNRINRILASNLTVNDKIKELLRIEVPKYKVESLLKDEGATRTRVELMDHYILTEESKELELTSSEKDKNTTERKKGK
jgi:hypothetical protein